MRQARIKPSEMDTFMHLYNRVVGHVGEFPFGPAEKEHFVRGPSGSDREKRKEKIAVPGE